MVAPEYGGDGKTPAERGRYKDPLIGFPGHWAPNDLIFYTGTQFPENAIAAVRSSRSTARGIARRKTATTSCSCR